MPDAFQFPYGAASVLHSVAPQARTDLWIPFDPPTDPALRGGRFAYVTGRLKRRSRSNRLRPSSPSSRAGCRRRPGWLSRAWCSARTVSQAVVARPIRRSLFVLFASVVDRPGARLANVANLSFVRMTRRSREVATRAALGRDRCGWFVSFLPRACFCRWPEGSLVRPPAWWGTQWLTGFASAQLPRTHEVGFDCRCLSFCLVCGCKRSDWSHAGNGRAWHRDATDSADVGVTRRRSAVYAVCVRHWLSPKLRAHFCLPQVQRRLYANSADCDTLTPAW